MKMRNLLPALAIVATLAVALSPGTSWLLRLIPGGLGSIMTDRLESAKQALVAQNPLDPALALAAAGSDYERVRSLAARFPEDISIRAAACRLAVRDGGVSLGIREKGLDKKPEYTASVERIREKALRLIEDAQAGQRLDPQNAFFPALETVGLLALHRDDEALAALQKAAALPRFNDFLPQAISGRLRLAEQAQGGRLPHLSRVATAAAEPLPHFAPLRSAARILRDEAARREKAGDFEGGFAIRRDIAAFGTRVRDGSSTVFGALVGVAIHAVATSQPGGVKLQKPGESEESARDRQQALVEKSWDDWARKVGHPEAVGLVAANQAVRASLKGALARVADRNPLDMPIAARHEFALFVASGLLLAITLTYGLFHGIDWLTLRASKRAREQEGESALVVHSGRLILPVLAISLAALAALVFLMGRFSIGGALVPLFVLACVPIMTPVALRVLARRAGLEPRATVVKNMRRVTPTLAWAFLLLWAGMQFVIAHHDDRWRAGLDACVAHETRELMRLDGGKPWPPE